MSVAAQATTVESASADIERHALAALHAELACYPKPGLVSPVDSGAHADMCADTFRRSIASLSGYFHEMAAAGACGADFRALNRIGRRAEARMLEATGGINTHRGAVFSLGLLAAAAGSLAVIGRRDPAAVCDSVAARWGRDILSMRLVQDDPTHGELVRSRYRVPGAREQAAKGFRVVLRHGLPALESAFDAGASRNDAAVQAIMAVISVLADNNLLYRAGRSGLAHARRSALAFLATGGMLGPDGYVRAERMHRDFVARNLSPGGSADLLAATLFLHGWQTGDVIA